MLVSRSIKDGTVLNETETVTPIPRLSEVLFESRERSFASIAPIPSNVEAIEAALLFCTGANALVALVGPSGWGKTHLLNAVAYRLSMEHSTGVDSLSVSEFLAGQGRTDPSHLILDDVQEVFARPRQRQSLYMALDRRVKAGRATILGFTHTKPNRQIKAFLPYVRDWGIACIGEPAADERVVLLNHMATAEGLSLSPRLVKILAHQLHGNGRTLSGALKRLRSQNDSWLDADATLRALGLMDPFFADNSSWDLKIKILRIADQAKSQFPRVNHQDLAIYTMLHIAGLGEADVARAAGVKPAAAFQRAARFQEQAAKCDTTPAYVRQFVELVVSSLAQE